jgi:hypothetical protein
VDPVPDCFLFFFVRKSGSAGNRTQPELITAALKYRTKEAEQLTPKKANTGSTKRPLPIATQLY